MPHLVLEYSEPLSPSPDWGNVMTTLADAVAATGIAKRDDLKLRAIGYHDVLLADGSRSFLHLTLSLLEGRTPEQKEHLAITCRACLVRACPSIDAISVDIRDMDAHAYKKRVLTPAERG